MTDSRPKLGTFGGVFTPTLLTILGVIMYLRLGWVIGNGGLVGGFLVMAVAIGITTCTGLSLSSIATNTRLGAGGPYAIIRRSLGIEVGGSVGVPLYVSQTFAVAMYVFGFREGWLWLFKTHNPLLVDLATFAGVFAIAFISAELAFRIQYVIMAVIFVSIALILASPAGWQGQGEVLWLGDWRGSPENDFSGTDFWSVFAVFFPAATGIMAGANMSGELANPRRSIPLGTMLAIGVAIVVYFVIGAWCAKAGTADELTSNYTFLIDRSVWAPGVLAGLLGATLSSAISSLVGAPRILVALVNDRVVPNLGGIGTLAGNGEPRRAMIASGVLVLLALLMRDLNAIAPLLSMFFLISYFVINVVVLLESSLRLQSYRPTFALPRFVPLIGAIGSLFAMFIINPTVSLLAVGVVMGVYVYMLRRGVGSGGDSRSGMFSAVAEWAAARATELESNNPRAWKPNLLVPVDDTAEVRGSFQLLQDLVRPEGSIKLLGIATQDDVADVARRMANLSRDFRKKRVFSTWSVLDSTDFRVGVIAGLQALRSAFFRPNVLFVELMNPEDDEDVVHMWRESRRLQVGLALLAEHPKAGLGKRSALHLWIPCDAITKSHADALNDHNLNLALLTALRLRQAWGAELRVFAVVDEPGQQGAAVAWLADLVDLARLPAKVVVGVMVGDLNSCLERAPQSDLDLFGLPSTPDLELVRSSVERTRSACLFLGDSAQENALV